MREVVRRVHKKIVLFHTKGEDAVSPVIATILMVAVTVVLAAAVYLLVSYYTPSPVPLYGSLTEQSTGTSSNSTTLLLTLGQPTVLKNPSYFHMQILNLSSGSTGVGWTIQNVTITNPDGTVLYMDTFISSGNVWTSDKAIPVDGATSIESSAFITIIFHTTGKPVVMSDLEVKISYTGTTGSIYTQLS
jgi:flagellin-like protein